MSPAIISRVSFIAWLLHQSFFLYAQSPSATPSPSPEFSSDEELSSYFLSAARPASPAAQILSPTPPLRRRVHNRIPAASCAPPYLTPRFANEFSSDDDEPPQCQQAKLPIAQGRGLLNLAQQCLQDIPICQWFRTARTISVRFCQCSRFMNKLADSAMWAIDSLWNLWPGRRITAVTEGGIYIDDYQKLTGSAAQKYSGRKQEKPTLVLDLHGTEYLLSVLEDLTFTLEEVDRSYPQANDFMQHYNQYWSFEENLDYWLKRKNITRFHFHNFHFVEELMEISDHPVALITIPFPHSLIIFIVNDEGHSIIMDIQCGKFRLIPTSELPAFLRLTFTETFTDIQTGSMLLADEDYDSSSESDSEPGQDDSGYNADSGEP